MRGSANFDCRKPSANGPILATTTELLSTILDSLAYGKQRIRVEHLAEFLPVVDNHEG